jgi:transposase-like protein
MSVVMEDEIKRWTAKRKGALVLEIVQGKKTVAEAARQFDLPPSELENWVDQAKAGMENALRASPKTFASSTSASLRICRKRTARRCWSCVREKNCSPCWARTRSDRSDPPGTQSRWLRGVGQSAVPMVRVRPPDDRLPIAEGSAESAGSLRRTDQSLDRRRAVVWLSHGGRAAGLQQEHGAAAVSDQRLAGEEAAGRTPTADRSPAVEGASPESTLGNRPVSRLGRTGRLGEPGGGHRLPHANCWAGTCHALAEQRQPVQRWNRR